MRIEVRDSTTPGLAAPRSQPARRTPVIARWLRTAALPFVLVLIWRLVLLAGLLLPVPSNDSFFYDGAVVNLLLNGTYANPSLALALPISGTQVFSAYPPLYQLALLPWMFVFGTSAVSAMVFHFVLFTVAAFLLYAILRRLDLPLAAFWLAGLFLLSITFHDRPDSLAHVFGLGSVYAWLRFHQQDAKKLPGAWGWWMATFAVLSFCTGLQLGVLYLTVLWCCVLGSFLFGQRRFPIGPMLASVFVPVLLVGGVIVFFPHLWAGFAEHARQTPALTGFRLPRIDELMKLGRTAPGILLSALLITWLVLWRKLPPVGAHFIALVGSAVPVLGLLAAAMCLVTPNAVMFTAWLQPVIVGATWAVLASTLPRPKVLVVAGVFVALALFAGMRAFGLSTWGVVCAFDSGYTKSLGRVRSELQQTPSGQAVVLSSAYLYEAARYRNLRSIHCDWLQPPGPDQGQSDMEGMLRLRPARLLLTQFDYYRRYEPVVQQLAQSHLAKKVGIENTAKVRTPDAIPPLRRVIQHLSWAPVVVTLEWINQGDGE